MKPNQSISIALQQGATPPRLLEADQVVSLTPGQCQLWVNVGHEETRCAWQVSEGDYRLSGPFTRTGGGGWVFAKEFNVAASHTDSTENSIRILVLKEDWTLEHHHVMVVIQAGRTFVVSVLKGAAPLNRYNGQLVCNHSQVFTDMVHGLEGKPETEDAPVTSVAPRGTPPAALTGNQGRVKWFNPARGVGAVVTPKGDMKVHWRAAPMNDRGFRALHPGQLIEILTSAPIRDSRSKFKHEITSLKLVEGEKPFESPAIVAVSEIEEKKPAMVAA